MPYRDLSTVNGLIAMTGAILITYGYRLGGLLLSERLPRAPAFRAFMQALPGTIFCPWWHPAYWPQVRGVVWPPWPSSQRL